MKDIKIGVTIMVNNMESVIQACINSVNWTDGIYIFNDHCTDNTIDIVRKTSSTKIVVEDSPFEKTAFEQSELETRNYIINKAFARLEVDALILLDADELIADTIKPVIISAFSNENIDRIAFNIWHLYDNKRYFHIWETKINNIFMVDPHIRVIKKNVLFQARFSDGSHPGIKFTDSTLCLHGSYHFHLKYMKKLKLPNYSFHFLPKYIKEKDAKPFLRNFNFTLPTDIQKSLKFLKTNNNKIIELMHHEEVRTKLKDVSEALVHPRDRKI